MDDLPTKLMRIADGALEYPDDEAIVRDGADALVKARLEIDRLRGHLHLHFDFARFVHLWTNRDNVTDAERVSVIKNHPSLRKWIEGDDPAPVNLHERGEK
jgi:hypothetical protein